MENKEENILNKLKSQDAMKLPENYFNEFSARLQDQIIEPDKKDLFILALFKRYQRSFAAMAVLIVLVASITYIKREKEIQEFAINNEDIENYFIEESDYNLDNDFIDYLASETNTKSESFDNEDLINYLIEDSELDLYELIINQ